jgi:hypothetical protein
MIVWNLLHDPFAFGVLSVAADHRKTYADPHSVLKDEQ